MNTELRFKGKGCLPVGLVEGFHLLLITGKFQEGTVGETEFQHLSECSFYFLQG